MFGIFVGKMLNMPGKFPEDSGTCPDKFLGRGVQGFVVHCNFHSGAQKPLYPYMHWRHNNYRNLGWTLLRGKKKEKKIPAHVQDFPGGEQGS